MLRHATLIFVLSAVCRAPLRAQETGTLAPHPADTRWWLSGQANFIFPWHGEFRSPYQGPNSLKPAREAELSRLLTLYTGLRVASHTEVLFDVESAGGRGISDALGLAGFTDLDAWRAGEDPVPSIEKHRQPGRIKTGAGVNVEQTIADGVRAFGRWGWNEGQHESFAYTEVNQKVEAGADVKGDRWSRANDKVGAVVIVNALSDDHQAYLAAGGLGFLLGDGHLTYGTERIAEAYYTARLRPGVFASIDLQRIVNPGYNQDRGPVLVPGLRLHLEF